MGRPRDVSGYRPTVSSAFELIDATPPPIQSVLNLFFTPQQRANGKLVTRKPNGPETGTLEMGDARSWVSPATQGPKPGLCKGAQSNAGAYPGM
jgi:hypothetical protein